MLMGQDIGPYGGVFKVTDGFVDAFGEERVRNTPLYESAIVGAGLGLSIAGKKAMVEMQFSDFVTCGFNQIVNNLAKIHWHCQAADVVVRMPTVAAWALGRTTAKAPKRGSSTSWLKIAYPPPRPTRRDFAHGDRRPQPGLFFEHTYLYRSLTMGSVRRTITSWSLGWDAWFARATTPRSSPTAWACNGRSRCSTRIRNGA